MITPLPDLPLPLPIPLAAAKVGLVVAFIAHIVFVNLTVGGTMIALHSHWRGRRDPELLDLAKRLVDAVTVHKSVAVVLGVGPLLFISLAYTGPFYTSSTLIAPAWLSVIWLVTLAFGLLYGYKFGWDTLRPRHPRWHGALGAGAGVVLLCIPLIYLTNTNLMLVPSAWAQRPGFFEAMFTVGNVIPRYLHFMLASLTIAGFWVALWCARRGPEEQRPRLRRIGVFWALIPTAFQFIAGPIVFATLPAGAITAPMLGTLAVGILAGAIAIFTLVDSLRGQDRVGRAALLLAVTVACMGTARHLVREALLDQAGGHFKRAAVSDKLSVVNLCCDHTRRGDGHGHQSRAGIDTPQAHGGGDVREPG